MGGLVEQNLVYWLNDGDSKEEVSLGKKKLKRLVKNFGPECLTFRVRCDLDLVIAKAKIPLVPKMEIQYYCNVPAEQALELLQDIFESGVAPNYTMTVVEIEA